MKLLYVDYYNEYGKVVRGINYIGVLGFEEGLKKIGHEVYHFYYDEFMNSLDILNKELLNCASQIKPDFIFFNLYTNHVYTDTINKLNLISKTINWFGDDQFLFESFTRLYAPLFTYCITTDKFSLEKYKEVHQNNVIYSQWPAYEGDGCDDKINNYKYDVSFIGAKNPVREWFLNELKNRGINISIFGNGWEAGPISNKEMYKIFKTSRINLNISNTDNWDYRFLSSGFCSVNIVLRTIFKYHLKKCKIISRIFGTKLNRPITFYGKYSSQIKARNFEIPCSCGFQLTDYVPSIEQYFIIGKEIVCYSNLDEAEKQIRYYLKNDEERETIKKAGFNRSTCEYTYEKVLKKIFIDIMK